MAARNGVGLRRISAWSTENGAGAVETGWIECGMDGITLNEGENGIPSQILGSGR